MNQGDLIRLTVSESFCLCHTAGAVARLDDQTKDGILATTLTGIKVLWHPDHVVRVQDE